MRLRILTGIVERFKLGKPTQIESSTAKATANPSPFFTPTHLHRPQRAGLNRGQPCSGAWDAPGGKDLEGLGHAVRWTLAAGHSGVAEPKSASPGTAVMATGVSYSILQVPAPPGSPSESCSPFGLQDNSFQQLQSTREQERCSSSGVTHPTARAAAAEQMSGGNKGWKERGTETKGQEGEDPDPSLPPPPAFLQLL